MSSRFKMHCPLCGHILSESKADRSDETDNSIWFKCDNCKSFGDHFPIVLHHPLRGIKSKPGDSWSLTWLK